MGIAVQFGAGAIGRGFLGQLFSEAGLEVVFVDVSPEIVRFLNDHREYHVRIVGPGARNVRVAPVRALPAEDGGAIAEAIAQAEIVATAVGAPALTAVAPAIAAGLEQRRSTNWGSLNILICENLRAAPAVLRDRIALLLPESARNEILAATGFVPAIVSRMAPLRSRDDSGADVRVEAYSRLPVDGATIVGSLPAIPGIEPVSDFEAHLDRKLFTHNCAHAVLGYCGYHAGYELAADAIADPRIAALVRAVMAETGAALIHRYGFGPEEQAAHEADLLKRFANQDLGDTCARLARDPLRKLAPGDRLVGAARLCGAEGVAPRAVAWGIAGALKYSNPADAEAARLAEMLRELGLETTLRRVCGIEPEEELGELIGESVRLMERGSLWR